MLKTNEIFRAIYWTSLLEIAGKFISLLSSILIARILLPEDFGTVAIIGIFTSIAQTLVQSGMTISLIRDGDVDDKDYHTVFCYNLLMSLAMYGLLYILAPSIASYFGKPILIDIVRILVISLVIQAFYSVQFTKLTKELEYKKLAIYQFVAIIIGTVIGLIAAYNNFGVWSLVVQTLTTEVTKVLIAWTMIFWKPKFIFQKDKFEKHFAFGYKMAASGLLNTVFNEIYTFVIGKYYSIANLGYYSRALSLSQYPSNTLSVIVHKVSFPMLSAIQNDDVQLVKMQKMIIQIILFAIAPILIIMGVLATPLFKVIYTEKWLPAVPIFQLLLINALLYPIHAFNLQIVGIKGRSDLFLKAEVYKKIIIAITIAVAIFIGGLYSVIIASIIASIFSLLVNVYFSNKVLDFGYWEQIKNIFPTVIYGVVMASMTVLLYKLFQQLGYSDLMNIICVGLVSLLAYFGIAYFIRLEPMREVVRILGRRNV